MEKVVRLGNVPERGEGDSNTEIILVKTMSQDSISSAEIGNTSTSGTLLLRFGRSPSLENIQISFLI